MGPSALLDLDPAATSSSFVGSGTRLVGETISHYRVLRRIGGGGMGDVYEAEDLNLGRHVALKFLSSKHAASPQAVQRLEREARSASALNHAHICTIYDIGNDNGERFIAMELLEGEPLRDHLRRGPLDPRSLLDLAIQVSDALAAAHRAHVVHRDVSPSNIFITREGTAKLLDFGLAKQECGTALRPFDYDFETRTMEPELTSPGAVMGTLAYMSPEQVRGDEVDHRTDTFSFGAVLYEMATGRRPFNGKTSGLIFDAILHATPEPVSTVNAAMPLGLQLIIDKALEKDRHLRYQSAEELRTDLERLRRDIESPDREPYAAPRRVRAWMVLLGVALLAVAGVAAYRMRSAGIPPAAPRQLTSGPGVETDPAIAPDGNTIAFTSDESGNEDIWIVDVHGGPARQLTNNPGSDTHASWFPDGRVLAFASDRRGRTDIWRTSVQDGDAATLLVADADNPMVSPTGTQIAFIRAGGGYTRVAVAEVSDPSRVRVLTSGHDGRWDHTDPAWSPDGKFLCYAAWDGLWLVPAAGGPVRRLTSEESDGHPAWSADGRYVYFQSYHDATATIWRVPAKGGTPERVTLGSGTELEPTLSRDGRLLSFSSSAGDRDLFYINLVTGRQSQFGTGGDDLFPTFGPDANNVYFVSDRWGPTDIWSQRLLDDRPSGSPHRVFEQAGVKSHPACSPDGRWLVYYQSAGGRRDIWTVATTGGVPIRITSDGSSFHPTWSPHNSAIAYVSERDGTPQIWKQDIVDGRPAGAATKLTRAPGGYMYFPAWSPDAGRLAFITSGPTGQAEVGIVASTGGKTQLITSGADAVRVRWSAESDVLLVSGRWGKPQYEIRSISVDGTAIQEWSTPVVLGVDPVAAVFDLSADGRFVVATRGKHLAHVWVLEAQSGSF